MKPNIHIVDEAKDHIKRVMDMILTDGVEKAREYAEKHLVLVETEGIKYTMTIKELMADNAEKRSHDINSFFVDKET